MPEEERRYRTTYPGYTIEEMLPDGGAKTIFRSLGCVWEDAPAYVHLSLQEKEGKMRDELHALAKAQDEKRKPRKNQ